ncbi:hypothetical protein PSPO01_03501 [Paraphaeosphaeria sporulosa]
MEDAYTHALAHLPTRLHTYNVTTIEDGIDDDERCLLCWRSFNEDEDTRANLPSWLMILADLHLYSKFNAACTKEVVRTDHAQSLAQHHKELLDGTISAKYALWLWLINMWGLVMLALPELAFAVLFAYGRQIVTFELCHLSVLVPKSGAFGWHSFWIRVEFVADICGRSWPQEFAVLLIHLIVLLLAMWKWGPERVRHEFARRFRIRTALIGPSVLRKVIGQKASLLILSGLGFSVLMYVAITALLIWYVKAAVRTRTTTRPKSD